MICMSSKAFSYTPDIVPFLEIIPDTFYIPKKRHASHHGNKMATRGPWEGSKCRAYRTLSWDTTMIVVSTIEFPAASNIVALS